MHVGMLLMGPLVELMYFAKYIIFYASVYISDLYCDETHKILAFYSPTLTTSVSTSQFFFRKICAFMWANFIYIQIYLLCIISSSTSDRISKNSSLNEVAFVFPFAIKWRYNKVFWKKCRIRHHVIKYNAKKARGLIQELKLN